MLDALDLADIRLIIQEELDLRIPLDGFTKMDGFIGDYNMYGYTTIPLDGFTKMDGFIGDYNMYGYPIISVGATVDLSPVQSVVDQIALDTLTIKGYTDTVETSLTAIKAKTDTITAVNLAPVQTVVDAIKAKTDTLTPFVATDLAPILSQISLVKSVVDLNLDAKVSTIYPQISALLSDPSAMQGMDYFNLNGNYGSYGNGASVVLLPNRHAYTVDKGYLFQNDTDQFIVMYVLTDALGKKMVAPHNFLELVVVL